MNKLLLLGGDALLLPVIKVAKGFGVHTITCDYLPSNVAHKYSDEYINFSTTDKENILRWAKENNIDGVLTFTDSGALTASYIAERLGLPYQCSYKAATILQDKALFRQFLNENNFNCPFAKGYSTYTEVVKDIDKFSWPVIVKPVDSAGSKGVTKVNDKDRLEEAINIALSHSQKKQIIIEDFLEKDGFSCGSEVFVVNGKIVFNGIYDQYFDEEVPNPYIPSGEIWPSILRKNRKKEFSEELQRLFDLLGVTTGLFNVEFRLCKDGKLYLMEVSPRAGGNRLAEILIRATGQNLIDAEVRKALSIDLPPLTSPVYNGHFAIIVLHSLSEGIFESIHLDESYKQFIIDSMILKQRGERVSSFTGANALIGTLFCRFDSREELTKAIVNQKRWVTIDIN